MGSLRPSVAQYAEPEMLPALTRHRCTGCGRCCEWPGHVIVYAEDIGRIAHALGMPVTEVVRRSCVVVQWTWRERRELRLALRKDPSRGACVYLDGTLCSIHEFKPLVCRAGPAGWSWISNPKAFWFYVRSSPSFAHESENLSLVDADESFAASRAAEARSEGANSLAALAAISGVPEEILERLDVLEFPDEEDSACQ